MEPGEGPGGPEGLLSVQRAIGHRVRGHEAALNAAEALGWPAILTTAVADTEARLDEARACLAVVDDALSWHRVVHGG